MSDLEDKTPAGASEPAASRMNPEDAEALNSDVRTPVQASQPVEQQPSEKLDDKSDNREAPHQTKKTANDPKNEKGRAN